MALEVRRLRPDDWKVLRELRLAALLDSPAAFCSTYADAAERDEAGWRAWPADGAAFAAWLDGEPVGMVGVTRRTAEPDVADLIAMWVAAPARGGATAASDAAPRPRRGVGDALVAAVLAWAADAGCTVVHLEVAPGNVRAERFYARQGFAVVDVPPARTGDTAMRTTFG